MEMLPVQIQETTELALRAVQALQSVNTYLKEQVAEMRPKADAYDLLEGNGDAMDMSAAAALVAEALGIKLGSHRLYSMLRTMGIVQRAKNHALQTYVDVGYFKNVSPVRSGHMRMATKVTPKGVAWLTKRVKSFVAGEATLAVE